MLLTVPNTHFNFAFLHNIISEGVDEVRALSAGLCQTRFLLHCMLCGRPSGPEAEGPDEVDDIISEGVDEVSAVSAVDCTAHSCALRAGWTALQSRGRRP